MNLISLFDKITEPHSPKIVGTVNHVYIKLARIRGAEVPWHHHDGQDEMFYVFQGSLSIEERDQSPIVLNAGDMHIVKRNVEHKVWANGGKDCLIMLIESKDTKHLGDLDHQLAKSISEQQLSL